jgi:hypothetical protein
MVDLDKLVKATITQAVREDELAQKINKEVSMMPDSQPV